MSKNLETEYKELLHSELPDLWARIEAGISEEVSTSNESKEPIMINEETKEQLLDQKEERVKAPVSSKKNWKRILFRSAGILAAGICLALLFPLLVILPRLSMNNSETENSAEDGYYDVGGSPCADYESEMGTDSAMPEERVGDVESVVISGDDSEEEMAEDTDAATEGTTQEVPVTNGTQSEDSESENLEEWTNEMTVEIQSSYVEGKISGYYADMTLLDGVEQPHPTLVFLRFATEEELQAFGGEAELVVAEDLEEGVTYEIWYLPTEENVTEVPVYIILDWK